MARIVILTGAGISAESGIRTFRAADGLWENHRVEDVATPEAFRRDPSLVYRFYNLRREQLLSDEVAANAAHEALARLEDAFPGEVLVVTQNIDDLHERGGSENVIHMHGELLQSWCLACDGRTETLGAVDAGSACAGCGVVGRMRPDIVWFGEIPYAMERIEEALTGCRIFAAIGTSGNVYPAAGFVRFADSVGAHTVELNLEASLVHSAFAEVRQGPATEVVPQWVDEVIAAGR
ncbi:MAG: NAD-dependent deacylase [Propionibacterium sp.]|nr:NAD-dependent deacylase [Propionibacterium sp.]